MEQAQVVTAPPSFGQTLKEALRGSPQDYTQGPIGRAVLLLAIPMVLEMSMESLFAVVDMFWVSRLGADAVATVGLTESLLGMLYAVAIGLSAGATALVARRTGEKDAQGAATAAGQALLVGLGASAVIGLGGGLFAPQLLRLMGAPASVLVHAHYTQVMLGGSATVLLLFLLNAIFRGVGDAVMAMRSLWLANLLNMALGPLFIFGLGPFPRLGVAGAAVATNLGRGLAVVFQLMVLFRGKRRLQLRWANLGWLPQVMVRLLRLSGTATFQTLLETASWLALVWILGHFGANALAGYAIAMRLAIFALLPSWGIANAAATLVGQNLGAGQPERAAQSVWVVVLYNGVTLGLVGLAFVAIPGPFVGLFTSDPSVIPFAVQCLRNVALGFFFYAFGMVMVQSFNGAGDTTTPTLVNFGAFWLFKIPLAYFLALTLGWGPRGVFIAVAAAYALSSTTAAVLFRSGSWKKRVV